MSEVPVYCGNCEKKVSRSAKYCPHCGHPLLVDKNEVVPYAVEPIRQPCPVQVEHTFAPAHNYVQTIEKTSKKWKGWKLITWASFIVFMLIAMVSAGNPSAAGICFLLGTVSFVAAIIVEILAWWYHG